MKKKIGLMIFVCFILLGVCGCNKVKKNIVNDTNEIKALCFYDAYVYQKQDGNTYQYLSGNSQKTNIEVNEKRDNSRTKYDCDIKKNDIYNSYGVDATCKSHSKTASNGIKLYSYNLTYNYDKENNINEIISKLKEQDYKCFIYYNKENSVINEAIIGTWCGYDPIIKNDKKIIFNEDGTGKYIFGKYTEDDFYYSIDDKNIISYNHSGSILQLAFNPEKNVIFNGMYLDSTTKDIIQDENVNYVYSKCE